MRVSRALSVARLRSRSKIPPQLGETRSWLPHPASSFRLSHRRSHVRVRDEPSRQCGERRLAVERNICGPGSCYQRLEELLPAGENFIERILKVRRRLGELLPHLIDVLLVALLDLLAKELLERPIAQPFLPLLRKVGDDVRYQRARQALRLDVRVVRQEGVDGARRRWRRRRR